MPAKHLMARSVRPGSRFTEMLGMRPGCPWAYLAELSELGADEAPEQEDAQEGAQG